MTEESAFAAAIAAEGATARLVFADWLDEENRHVDAAIQRVLAQPDSDELRLAFADACEEEAKYLVGDRFIVLPETKRGRMIELLNRRAELARVQCEIAAAHTPGGHVRDCYIGGCAPVPEGETHPCKVCGPLWDRRSHARKVLHDSVRSGCLLTDDVDYWIMNEPVSFPPDRVPVKLIGTFCRGFIERLVGSATEWISRGDEMCGKHPIRTVRLTSEAAIRRRGRLLQLEGFDRWFSGRQLGEELQRAIRTNPFQIHDDFLLWRLRWPGISFEYVF